MNQPHINIVPFQAKYAEQTVNMWRDSKERAIGQKETHSVENHLDFLTNILPEHYHIDIALIGERVVGMVAYHETELNQLYVHVEFQGMGIGQMLLDKVKAQSRGRLTLYTFDVNKNAQRFYEKNGFNIIGRGHENEENLPDIQYEWKSEDK